MGKVSVCHYKHRLVYTSCLNQIFLEKDEKYKMRRYIMSVYRGFSLP